MDPIISAGLLNLGGGLISDIFGSKQASANRKLTQQQMAMQRDQFNAQMDQSIQRRVKDAQAAGVHPLFALGASVGASPTAQIGGGQPVTGSALGKGIQALTGRMLEAGLREKSSSARLDEAQAAYYDAQRKKLEQDLGARGRDGVQTYALGEKRVDNLTSPEIIYGPAKYESPTVPMSQAPGVAAGTIPTHVQMVKPDGRTMLVLNPDYFDDLFTPAVLTYGYDEWKKYVTEPLVRITGDAKDAAMSRTLHSRMQHLRETNPKEFRRLQREHDARMKWLRQQIASIARRFQ